MAVFRAHGVLPPLGEECVFPFGIHVGVGYVGLLPQKIKIENHFYAFKKTEPRGQMKNSLLK
jgi:hypothetical protein